MSAKKDDKYSVVFGKLCDVRKEIDSTISSLTYESREFLERCYQIIGLPIESYTVVTITIPESKFVKIEMVGMTLEVTLDGYVVGETAKIMCTLDDGHRFNALLLADVKFDGDKLLVDEMDSCLNDILQRCRTYSNLNEKVDIWNHLTNVRFCMQHGEHNE